MAHGYNGKILRVDLTSGKISIEEPEENIYRRYLGGTGIGVYYLLKELKPGVDPLGAENKLIFASGLITGAPIGGTARNAIVTKSPMSNGINTSEAGGYWGAELKRAGFDAVIIEGRAAKPVYLWIEDGRAEIKDASHLWGKSVGETQDMMRQELDDSAVRTALIGPGGEKLVRFACVVNDLGHFSGRGGTGAVMGSKNLKGIAVRGHNSPTAADPEGVKELTKWVLSMAKSDPFLVGQTAVGTIDGPVGYSAAGGYCVRNFQAGVFPGVEEKLSPEAYFEELGRGRGSCYACPIHCKHEVKIKDTHGIEFDRYHGHGMEYESLTSFGPLCDIGDIQAIACANELCTAYGVDTISCGATIACAMECFEKGLITLDDTGGLKLEFGNVEAMVKVVGMICERQGFGDILAEGSLRATKKFGKGAEQYAMQTRGVELAMQNPYFKPILGLGYAVCPTGGDHVRNHTMIHVVDAEVAGKGSHTEARDELLEQYKSLGRVAPQYRRELTNTENIRTLISLSIFYTVFDSVGICWLASPGVYSKIAEMVSKLTGWDANLYVLMKAGERTLQMMRAFNVREGFTRDDDRIPERFHQPLASGPLKGAKLDKEEFEKAKDIYYSMIGWDAHGNPTRGKLMELDIEWVADELQKASD